MQCTVSDDRRGRFRSYHQDLRRALRGHPIVPGCWCGVVQNNCTEKSSRSSLLRLELQKQNKTRVEKRWKMSLLKGSGTGHSFHPQASEPASDNTLVGFLSEAGTQPGKLEACSLSVPTGKLRGRRMDPSVAL